MTCVRSGLSLGVLARPVPGRTATERRAACFGIRSHLRLPAAVRSHWLAQAEKKNHTVSGFISVISAQRATRHEPLAACKAERTDTCLRIRGAQTPTATESVGNRVSSGVRQPGDEQTEVETVVAKHSFTRKTKTNKQTKQNAPDNKRTPARYETYPASAASARSRDDAS